MKTNHWVFLVLAVSALQLGMGSSGQYDEEARALEKAEKEQRTTSEKIVSGGQTFVGSAATGVSTGVKETVTGTGQFLKDTAEGTVEQPIIGTVKGINKGSEKLLEKTSKGVAEVATLGFVDADSYKVEQPKHGTDETTKVSFSF